MRKYHDMTNITTYKHSQKVIKHKLQYDIKDVKTNLSVVYFYDTYKPKKSEFLTLAQTQQKRAKKASKTIEITVTEKMLHYMEQYVNAFIPRLLGSSNGSTEQLWATPVRGVCVQHPLIIIIALATNNLSSSGSEEKRKQEEVQIDFN